MNNIFSKYYSSSLIDDNDSDFDSPAEQKIESNFMKKLTERME